MKRANRTRRRGKLEEQEELVFARVESVADIARVAAASIGMGQPVYLIRYKKGNNSAIIGMLAVLRDYYTLYGIPMFYYYECKREEKECSTSNYLAFKLDEDGEKVELTNKNMPGHIMIPILNLTSPPEFLQVKGR